MATRRDATRRRGEATRGCDGREDAHRHFRRGAFPKRRAGDEGRRPERPGKRGRIRRRRRRRRGRDGRRRGERSSRLANARERQTNSRTWSRTRRGSIRRTRGVGENARSIDRFVGARPTGGANEEEQTDTRHARSKASILGETNGTNNG